MGGIVVPQVRPSARVAMLTPSVGAQLIVHDRLPQDTSTLVRPKRCLLLHGLSQVLHVPLGIVVPQVRPSARVAMLTPSVGAQLIVHDRLPLVKTYPVVLGVVQSAAHPL